MEKFVSLIENSYGLQIYNLEKIKNAYKLETSSGLKCMKRSNYDLEQYKFIMNAMQHLINNEYEHILHIENTIKGESYIKMDNAYGFLCDWIESEEVNFDKHTELKLCIESLGKLHIYSRGFDFKCKNQIRNLYGKWIKRMKKRCDEMLYFKMIIENKKCKREFDNIYLDYFDEYYYEALKAVKELMESDYQELMITHKSLSGFCHHDTANHNFIITPQKNIYLIDFDYCIYDSHLHDLGSIIIRNLRHGKWSVKRMGFIIKQYNEIINLNEKELEVLRCFIEFPQDFWQIGLQYYIEKLKWEEEIFLKRLRRIVEDFAYRRVFLKELEGGIMLDFLK